MTHKEQLYYLIREYIKGNYETYDFCNQFTIIFNIEVDFDDLNETEYNLFSDLKYMTARFSPFEEEFSVPNPFYTEKQVKEKVLLVQRQLDENG